MKKIIFILILITTGSYAQQGNKKSYTCGTVINDDVYKQNFKKFNYLSKHQNKDAILYFPIKFVILDDPNTGNALSNTDNVYNIIDELNTSFNSIGIGFMVYNKIDYVNSSVWKYCVNKYNFKLFQTTMPGPYTDLITVYVVPCTNGFGAIAIPPSPVHRSSMIVKSELFNNSKSVVIHEMGHIFGLVHTHHGSDNLNPTMVEKVDGSNCSYAGDAFCDTPADPNLSGMVTPYCQYVYGAQDPTQPKDPNGDYYTNVDIKNFMSYSNYNCINSFSQEQSNYMYNVSRSNSWYGMYSIATNIPCENNTSLFIDYLISEKTIFKLSGTNSELNFLYTPNTSDVLMDVEGKIRIKFNPNSTGILLPNQFDKMYISENCGGNGTPNRGGDVEINEINKTNIENNDNFLIVSPNPSSDKFYINYKIEKENSKITIKIYDLKGSLIKIIENGIKDKGEYEVTWDASEYAPSNNAYIVHVLINNKSITRQLVLIK